MIFEVTDDQIELLGDADLRTLVAYLCEQEVRALGHSPVAVTWGGHQNAPDGGIDVRVALTDGAAISGYIPAATTGFQVKAQDMPHQRILDEMAPGGSLRASIADLASKGGAYIIVSSHGSVADPALENRKEAMRATLNGVAGVNTLTVDFYDRRRLATWVNLHPGLIPWVREKIAHPLAGWRPFADWSSSPVSIDQPYLLDDTVRLVSPSIRNTDGLDAADGVNYLRQILVKPKCIVRLVGLSGVGKTRLVQALFDSRIGNDPLPPSEAIYADISDGPDPVPLGLASHLISLRQRAVLIIDNCGIELHRKLATRISEADCPLSLITVEYNITDDEPENTDVFKLEVASVGLIEKILETRFPALAAPSRSVIAEFSHGNARIAFALAETAKNGESLANLHDTELFKRLFEQMKGSSEPLLNAAKTCALLYSFDGETLDGNDSELTRLASLAGSTVDQLYAYVAELRRRQLVQKRGQWRAMLPHAIAHRLAKLALQDIPFQRIESVIVNGGSGRMLRSFSKRMGYLHDNELAAALIAKWFSPGGLLEPIGKLNELGKAILTNVAPIDPAATLTFIEQAAARHDWFFGAENSNRAEIVRLIRSIAYDPDLFDRCVLLLKDFSLNDKDRFDTATDALKSLFYLHLSGTHASAAQRATFIRELLESASENESALGLQLLEIMLQCGPFSSHYPFEFGARSRDFGWYPRTEADFLGWYKRTITTAEDVGMSDCPIGPRVRRLVASNFSELCLRVGMVDELVAAAERFSHHSGWPEGWVGVRSAVRKCKRRIDESKLSKLEALSERLRPSNITDMVRSYALMKEWGPLDIAATEEDDDEEQPGRLDAHERVFELCIDLGQQLARNEAQFDFLLPEILASDSQRTYAIGKGLALGCESPPASWDLLRNGFLALANEERKVSTLAGFLEGSMARDSIAAENFLDGFVMEPRMHPYLLYCQVRAGLNDRAFVRIMSALDLETVPVHSYADLAYGRAHEKLDDEKLRELLQKILTRADSVGVAAEILGMRIFGRRSAKLPVSETTKATGRDLLEHVHFQSRDQRFDHMLGDIIETCLDLPEHEALARALCGRVIEGIRSYKVYASDINDVIEALAKTFPIPVLDILVEQANDKHKTARGIFREIREDKECPLRTIPDQALMEWAAAKPQSRYVDLARVIKFSNTSDDGKSVKWSSAAQKIIDAAPDSGRVLNVFFARFSPMSWSGSRADTMAKRIPLIESLLRHSRPEVAAWSKAYKPKFARMVEQERDSETGRDRSRDERFE